MMFKIGDILVYPAHGVGIVESIDSQDISGFQQSFYVLRIIDNDLTIMVPTGNVDSVGLRKVVSEDKIEKVYTILKERDVEVNTQNWNRRYRGYMEKIKTGSVFELAEVMRDLSILKMDKNLSFGERRMLDQARGLLVKELAIAEEMSEYDICEKFDSIFSC